MKFRIFGRLPACVLLAALLFLQSHSLPGQTPTPTSADPADEAARRLEWLKSHFGANALPQATPAPLKKHFADTRAPTLRPIVVTPTDADAPKKQIAESPTVVTPTAAPKIAEAHPAETRPKTAHPPSPTSVATATPSPTPRLAETHPPEPRPKTARSPAALTTPKPSPVARIAEAHTLNPQPPAVHAAASPTPNPRMVALRAAETSPVAKSTPAPRHPESLAINTRITDIHSLGTPAPEPDNLKNRSAPTRITTVAGRYPWKTGIVTTVFWVGEPVGGHNFTPNYASSWDANWARTYGGFDNPDPNARRNFIPVNFTPRQNPFYCALPYNDVTRGTTKPEARVMIPWFREVFRKEGQSVCRDRWVAIHSRTGRIAYAQWSDCGPFRTDHWQYVFGSEKPRPNLNQGAGLDVSPAVRDYLGLESTDVTDWKFVDDKEVPNGPWALYGDNNTCAQRGTRLTRASATSDLAVTRIHAY